MYVFVSGRIFKFGQCPQVHQEVPSLVIPSRETDPTTVLRPKRAPTTKGPSPPCDYFEKTWVVGGT